MMVRIGTVILLALVYCGWYSLKKYVDAFEFVDGAIGYHIASFEAVNLRDPNSSQWCPSMLIDGITATFGAVSEPYLHSFP
ncbi:MAG: TIGR03790 family protein [Sedimentisphaerales bacterium]